MKPTAMQKSVEKEESKTTPSSSNTPRPKNSTTITVGSNSVRSPSSTTHTSPLQGRLRGELTQILGDKDGAPGGRGVAHVSAVVANDRKNMPTLITSRDQREPVLVKSSSTPPMKPPLLQSSVLTPSAKSPPSQSFPSPFKSPVLVESKSTSVRPVKVALPGSNGGSSAVISPGKSAVKINGYTDKSVSSVGSMNSSTHSSLPRRPADEPVPLRQSSSPPSEMSPVKQTSHPPQSPPSHLHKREDASPKTEAINSVPRSSSSHYPVQTGDARPKSSHRGKSRKASRTMAMSSIAENGGGCSKMSGIAEIGGGSSVERRSPANVSDVRDVQTETFHVTVKSSPVSAGAEEEEEVSFAGRKDLTDARSVREKQIVSAKGTVRGHKNRVRAGIDTFLDQASMKFNYRTVERGQIVMYTTSMTVVRGTHDRCRRARDILHTHMVRYEQRDVFFSLEHQRQVKDRLPSAHDVPLPQIFIDGQHLGGALELEKLNESGELRKILHRFPKIQVRGLCDACGGFRFVPCELCHGSKKSLHRNHFTEELSGLRCTHCNENGLQRCLQCPNQVQ